MYSNFQSTEQLEGKSHAETCNSFFKFLIATSIKQTCTVSLKERWMPLG